jgi:hypothetical protein
VPGGFFIGLVAFLQAEHDNSCFHMTANGIVSLLEQNGFTDIHVAGAGGKLSLEYLVTTMFARIKVVAFFIGKIARIIEILRFYPEKLRGRYRRTLLKWEAAICFCGTKPG